MKRVAAGYNSKSKVQSLQSRLSINALACIEFHLHVFHTSILLKASPLPRNPLEGLRRQSALLQPFPLLFSPFLGAPLQNLVHSVAQAASIGRGHRVLSLAI